MKTRWFNRMACVLGLVSGPGCSDDTADASSVGAGSTDAGTTAGVPTEADASPGPSTSTTSSPPGTSSESDTSSDSATSVATSTSASDESSSTDTTTSTGEPVCGDGLVQGEEECDDGNDVLTDDCLPGCKSASCGDFVTQVGVEECDDGNHVDDDQCTGACTFATCGDGIVGPDELCDDGNEVEDDGCSNLCILASCGDGDIQAPEACDDGVATADCDADCTAAVCGDGTLNISAGEACDDGGESATCDADCSTPVCGDDLINAAAGEACDDGGESPTCNADCTSSTCGDGILNVSAGEACDDGNLLLGDLCSQSCTELRLYGTAAAHTCVVYADKKVHCWGFNATGGLGYGDKNSRGDNPGELPTPPVYVGADAIQVDAGGRQFQAAHTCAVIAGGAVRCWGANHYGQLGYNSLVNLGDMPGELPTADVAVGAAVLQVGAGAEHTCALVAGGEVRCWGFGLYGALGNGGMNNVLKPTGQDVAGIAGATQVVAGGDHTCVLMGDGTVRCWGHNQFGQLGLGHILTIGDEPNEMPPPKTPLDAADKPVIQLAAGYRHTCALLVDGEVRCWGSNESVQTGIITLNDYDSLIGDAPGDMPPPDVVLGGPAVQVVAGREHSCALMKTRRVKCWGAAPAVGQGSFEWIDEADEFPPPDVNLGGDVASIHSHLGGFTCAQLVNGDTRCWGANGFGQLGLGNNQDVGDNEVPAWTSTVPL